MKAPESLTRASQLVSTDRAAEYGDMKENMQRTADLWNAYLNGKTIDAKDAAVMLGLVKVARISTGIFKPDNFIDLAGYAAIAGQVSE